MEVSVVLCTYNGEQFIAEQLNSILQQTYPIKEILVFDDCSADDTMQILLEFQDRFSNLKVHQNQQNLGFNKNFEQALRAASGDVIAISDQDDVWVTTKIEKMIKAWKPHIPLINCKSLQFHDKLPVESKINPDSVSFEGTDGRKLSYFNSISGHALMIRKIFLPKVLPFTEGIMYDWWMGVVAAYNGGVQFLPEVLVYQRVHQSNITVTKEKVSKAQKIKAHNLQAAEHHKLFAKAPGVLREHQIFFQDFAELLQSKGTEKLNKNLFAFLIRNRKLIFYYKKSFNIISYIKHSYRIAKY